MVQSLKLANAFKYGPQHYLNVRSSLNFAFNSSRMAAPAHQTHHANESAMAKLGTCVKQFELLYNLQADQIKLSTAETTEKDPTNSPYGAWMSLYFPIGRDEALRKQFRYLDMNTLRMGKIIELIDMLTHDSCDQYI